MECILGGVKKNASKKQTSPTQLSNDIYMTITKTSKVPYLNPKARQNPQ